MAVEYPSISLSHSIFSDPSQRKLIDFLLCYPTLNCLMHACLCLFERPSYKNRRGAYLRVRPYMTPATISIPKIIAMMGPMFAHKSIFNNQEIPKRIIMMPNRMPAIAPP